MVGLMFSLLATEWYHRLLALAREFNCPINRPKSLKALEKPSQPKTNFDPKLVLSFLPKPQTFCQVKI
jgi:hypothetical protein